MKLRIFVMLLITATFSLGSCWVSAETLEVTYLNNPRSMKTFSYINTQCAAHYLSNAEKVTDQIAKQTKSTKEELVGLLVQAYQFHMGLIAATEGALQRQKGSVPIDTDKYIEQIQKRVIGLAAAYAPLPVEYASTVKICQAIQENTNSYTSKLDKP